jgi:D-alanyl-D-alanine carboxypeptidase
MRGYVETTWGRFDEAAVRQNTAAMIATGTYAIIQHAGEDIGVLHVERERGDIWIAHLFILPEHQKKGIGSRFLRELKREAAALGKPLRLRVLTVNPARRLYEREGFTTFTTTPGRTYMQWLPDGVDMPSSAGSCSTQLRGILDACGITEELIAERYLVVQPEARELELVAQEPSGREHRLAPAAARAWRGMRSAAAAQGVVLQPVSTYRSVQRQAEIVRAKLALGHAIRDILKVSAPPGYSEHHTGLAIDIGTPGVAPLEIRFEDSPAYAWLRENAGAFGFRLSYPRANPYGFAYEPWHWRFTTGS